QSCVRLIVPQGAIESFTADTIIGLGWHSPVYARVEPARTLRVTRAGTAPLWMVSVFDLSSENPVAYVEWVPVWSEAGAIARAVGIRITRAASTDYLLVAEPVAEATTV